jgi:phosphoglycolate phosphatase
MPKDFILFDLDGTLTDPAQGITNSLMYALKCYGIKTADRSSLYKYIGPPLLETFSKGFGFSPEKSAEAVRKYREYFADKGLYENKVYEGIPGLLNTLKSDGKTLIVATSKPEEYSVCILKHFGLDHYFSYICGSNMDESRSRKSEVIAYALDRARVTDKSRAIMTGDRMHDIIGANECGIASCGVLFGYGSRTELEEAGAGYIAADIQELERILRTDAQRE